MENDDNTANNNKDNIENLNVNDLKNILCCILQITQIMQNQKCLEILKHYGVSPLLRKFTVECDKAKKAALNYDYEANEITKQLLINELADVEIMLQQLKLAIGYETVNKEIDFKLNKQLREIELK